MFVHYKHRVRSLKEEQVVQQRIAIDMDEVIADSVSAHLDLYEQEFNIRLTAEQMAGRKLSDVVRAEHRDRIEAYPHQIGFFKQLRVMPDSQAVLQQLVQRYEVFITTAAMEYPTSFNDKFAWLREHFPFIPWTNIVFCGDKSIIAADYLIDDNVRHFKRFRGEGIIFSAPHNLHEQGYRRVHNWREVRELFLA
jgi:5'-nucleotidase